MARPKDKGSDILAWATTERPSKGGGKCPVCRVPAVRDIVDAVAEIRRSGQRTVTQRQLLDRLRADFDGFECSSHGLRDHLEDHTPGWGGRI